MEEELTTDDIHGHDEFLDKNPAITVPDKPYTLEADIVTGWKPKLKVLGPIPFNFDNGVVDDLVDQLTSFGSKYNYRVIYLGYRHQSSFKMQCDIKKNYNFKHQSLINSNFSHMGAYFRKFHANFKSKNCRLFRGMNPTLRQNEELTFDSNFQSGNLDTVIKVSQHEYDLFMRIDTNTRGHVQWFNFTVKNKGFKKAKINICNFKKSKTLYARGMKPYLRSDYLSKTKGIQWHQGGDKVKFQRKQLRYRFLQEFYSPQALFFNFLRFQYVFNDEYEQVQFAYCPPFTYSQNLEMIRELKFQSQQAQRPLEGPKQNSKKQMSQKLPDQQSMIIREEILCESLGGLDLQLLTITDFNVEDRKKKCILVSGRIHPGQTCGSHMIKGFLQFVCSQEPEAKELRKKVVFKVIPMLNPDGVTAGNFRTSLCGRDLNRTFKSYLDLMIPEVKALKELVFKLRRNYQNRLIYFIDFHGHSVKKNVFLYGPQYQIWQPNYYKTRVFPRILSGKTEMFRYYSCLFRIATFKRGTARAVILRNIPHCYTIEASTGFYYSNSSKKDIDFKVKEWVQMGKQVGKGIYDYVSIFYNSQITNVERSRKIQDLKSLKVSPDKKNEKKVNDKFQTRVLTVGTKQKKPSQQPTQGLIDPFASLPKQARQMIEIIKRQEEKRQKSSNEDEHESDDFSEGGSDSEGSQDDIPDQQLDNLHEQILNSMKEFRQQFYNTKEKAVPFRQEKLKLQKRKEDSMAAKTSRQSKKIETMACLRKKIQDVTKNKKPQSNMDFMKTKTNTFQSEQCSKKPKYSKK